MDDQPFEAKTEQGPLISIPNTVGPMTPMMIVQDHTAAMTAAWAISSGFIRKANTTPG